MQSVYGKYRNKQKAKELLLSDSLTSMTVLVICCDIVTEGACFTWEIDSILEELSDEECLPPEKSRDRLLGGIAALANPAYLWDSSAFMALSQTINGNLAIPHIWEPLSPAQVAYSLDELNYLNKVYNNASGIEPLFGEEPKIYMAGCLRDSGMPSCPKELNLCQDQLERFFEIPNTLDDTINNPILKRKLEEITMYVSTMSKLRAKKIAELE